LEVLFVRQRLDACSSLGDHEYVTTLRKIEPYKPVKTQEPIQMSKMPDAHKCDGLAPIERDYWPAPPAAAAAYPDLCKSWCTGRLQSYCMLYENIWCSRNRTTSTSL